MADRIYHFVPKERAQEFRDAGWQESAIPLRGAHGEYSVLMWREDQMDQETGPDGHH